LSQPNDGPSNADSTENPPPASPVVQAPDVLAGPRADAQLVAAKDQRLQRWLFYSFLTLFSTAYFGLFLCVVARTAFHALRWSVNTTPVDAAMQLDALGVALSKFPPTTSAIMGAVIASVVAIPLSLCVAIGKLVKSEQEAPVSNGSSFTSAFFELGKAFATGWKAVKS